MSNIILKHRKFKLFFPRCSVMVCSRTDSSKSIKQKAYSILHNQTIMNSLSTKLTKHGKSVIMKLLWFYIEIY
jgi:hypothetical protein